MTQFDPSSAKPVGGFDPGSAKVVPGAFDPGSAKPLAAAPQPTAPTSTIQQSAEKPKPIAALRPLDAMVRGAKVQQHQASIDPIGWVDAVLGGPQRAVEGLITSHGDLGHAWQVMTHPRDAAMQETELKKLMTTFHISEPEGNSILAKLGRAGTRFGVQFATDPINLVPILGQFRMAEKGLLAARAVSEAVRGVGAALPAVEKVAKVGEVIGASSMRRVAKQIGGAGTELFGRRPELAKSPKTVTRGGDTIIKAGQPLLSKQRVNDRIGIETKMRSYEAAQGAHDQALLADHAKDLRNVKPGEPLPDAIRHRYLFEPWAHGTPQMREEAKGLEFAPTDEEVRAFPKPTEALNYRVRDDYQTLINPTPESHYGDMPILRDVGGAHRDEFAGFEKSRTGEKNIAQTDQFERTQNRLAIGRARVRQQLTDRETEQYLTAHVADEKAKILKENGIQLPPGGKLKPDVEAKIDAEAQKRAGWLAPGPVDASLLSHGPVRVAPGSPGRIATRLQKQAIAINPFPHGLKNVGTLTFLHGGPEAFGRGLGYAQKGLQEDQSRRLVDMGLDADYVRNIAHPLEDAIDETPGALERIMDKAQGTYGKWTEGSSKILNRLELGYRQALLDQLDKKWPRLAEGSLEEKQLEFKKATVIRQALGDYRNTSRFVSALEAFGGPFVTFRVGIVPGAVARSIVSRPNYVESIARGQQDWNDVAGGPSELELGGPIHDAASLASNPQQYMMSPSTIGPLGIAARYMDPNRTATGGQLSEDALRSFVPGFSIAEDTGLAGRVFGGYGAAPGTDVGENAFASTLGAYYRRRPSKKSEQRFESQERRAP